VATTETGSHELTAGESAEVAAGEPKRFGVIRTAQLAGGGRPVRRVHWYFEVLLAVAGYLVYAEARTLHGKDAKAYKGTATRHGQDLFDFEKAIHIDWEKGLQHLLLPYKGFLQVVGGFYGGAHFVVTIGVLVWMLIKRPQFYRFWRSALFLLTMTAVGIFALFPAMPPRLLKDSSGHTITVDTLDKIGGLWSYNHGVIERISDGYAPMPSLHLGWSTWVAMSLWFTLPARSLGRKVIICLYPLAIYFTVIATGTHFVIDGVAGMALTGTVVTIFAVIVVAYRKKRHGDAAAGSSPVSTPV
jgi:hypothetical protein